MPPPSRPSDLLSDRLILHASTVARYGRAVLIRGASGSGKSALALQMMALGARLVADDRTILSRKGEQVIAEPPETIRGRIEARGIGILAADTAGRVPVRLIVDLDTEETDRLPPLRKEELLGIALPLVRKSAMPHFPAALMLYLEGERLD